MYFAFLILLIIFPNQSLEDNLLPHHFMQKFVFSNATKPWAAYLDTFLNRKLRWIVTRVISVTLMTREFSTEGKKFLKHSGKKLCFDTKQTVNPPIKLTQPSGYIESSGIVRSMNFGQKWVFNLSPNFSLNTSVYILLFSANSFSPCYSAILEILLQKHQLARFCGRHSGLHFYSKYPSTAYMIQAKYLIQFEVGILFMVMKVKLVETEILLAQFPLHWKVFFPQQKEELVFFHIITSADKKMILTFSGIKIVLKVYDGPGLYSKALVPVRGDKNTNSDMFAASTFQCCFTFLIGVLHQQKIPFPHVRYLSAFEKSFQKLPILPHSVNRFVHRKQCLQKQFCCFHFWTEMSNYIKISIKRFDVTVFSTPLTSCQYAGIHIPGPQSSSKICNTYKTFYEYPRSFGKDLLVVMYLYSPYVTHFELIYEISTTRCFPYQLDVCDKSSKFADSNATRHTKS